jgi:serine/threonine-protein kinase RIO1
VEYGTSKVGALALENENMRELLEMDVKDLSDLFIRKEVEVTTMSPSNDDVYSDEDFTPTPEGYTRINVEIIPNLSNSSNGSRIPIWMTKDTFRVYALGDEPPIPYYCIVCSTFVKSDYAQVLVDEN